MYKDFRYINAGENEFYRYGKKAQEKLKYFLTPNEAGFYSIPTDGGKYWTFGTSTGKYGEFARYQDTIFSVNSIGFLYAKVGTPKADAFVKMINNLLEEMKGTKHEQAEYANARYDAHMREIYGEAWDEEKWDDEEAED